MHQAAELDRGQISCPHDAHPQKNQTDAAFSKRSMWAVGAGSVSACVAHLQIKLNHISTHSRDSQPHIPTTKDILASVCTNDDLLVCYEMRVRTAPHL